MPGEGHDSHGLPEEWKYLPFLALPDGAHNYQEGKKFERKLHVQKPPTCFYCRQIKMQISGQFINYSFCY